MLSCFWFRVLGSVFEPGKLLPGFRHALPAAVDDSIRMPGFRALVFSGLGFRVSGFRVLGFRVLGFQGLGF